MIPVLRSLVSATCWLLHEWPRNTEVHQATVLCEQRRTRKRFILEQDYGRVQSVRTARRGAERKQRATRVQQPYPLGSARFEASRVLRPEVRAAHVLAVRHTAPTLISQARTGQVQQQLVQRDRTGSRISGIALQVIQRDRV